MQIIDRTFPTPGENLACDEALLELSEQGLDGEVLRFWEPKSHFVVLGYSGRTKSEVRTASCQKKGIPILRRASGGGTVLQGPGCLNFALILKMDGSEALKNISKTNLFVLERHKRAMENLMGRKIEIRGHTDLTLGTLKFSGNAQRRRKRSLLFHGSFLLKMDISLIEELLPLPERRPAYRGNRSHRDFLINLNLSSRPVKKALRTIWGAQKPLDSFPREKVGEWVREKYGSDNWNFKF